MTNRDIFRELGSLDPELVAKAAPEQTQEILTPKPRALRPVYKRLIACAASLALVLGVMSAVGFDNVYAAVREILAFIPGVGIQQAQEGEIYTWEPVTERVEQGSGQAQILRATYTDGALEATVHIDGKAISSEDIRFYVNGELCDLHGEDHAYYSLAVASSDSMLDFALRMEAPSETDLYEIQIDGFQERLAFTMTPCKTYEDLCQIGPTVTKNGIALTVTAHRVEEELVVWCYETREPGAPKDDTFGYGQPANGSYKLVRYLETPSGSVEEKQGGWQLRNRMVFALDPADQTATLHIPYLAMLRQEKATLKVALPQGHTTAASEASVNTSLGRIRLVSVERGPDPEDATKDQILLRFAYDNVQPDQRLYSFVYEIKGNHTGYIASDGETGTTEYIGVTVDRDAQDLELSISGLFYYRMGEYEIELDIP